jgi:hypothetical protein
MVESPEPTVEERELALKRYDSVLRYLGTEVQVYWTRSQLFLVANAALLGFELNNIPVWPDVRWNKVIVPLLGALVGGVLCFLWRRGLDSGEGWMEHWKAALRQWEELAFGSLNLYRTRPKGVKKSGVGRKAAWLFQTLWFLVAAYLLACLFWTVTSPGGTEGLGMPG